MNMNYLVLFQIALVFVLVLSVAVLKWRANAGLFETCWKESDRERANLEVRIADTENERLNLAVDLSDLQATMRLREKELTDLREQQHAPVTVQLQRILDYSHQYDAGTRKEIRGLAAKLMRV